MSQDLRCPVCTARFRGSRLCSRCGADLSSLMTLAAQAWALRESARYSIRSGDYQTAVTCAAQAQTIHATNEGTDLVRLAEWLSAAQV